MKGAVMLALAFTLTACSSGPVATSKKRDDPPPNVPAVPAVPAPAESRQSPPEPVLVAPSAPSRPTVQEPKVAASTAKKSLSGDTGEFAPDMVGGKPLSKWVQLLDSTDKNVVVEAINAVKISRSKAAVPKLTELAKNNDREIANEATEALRKIGAN